MPESPYVFISYASADRDRVLPIVDRLEQAGVRVWIDREGIHGGANYALEITEALKSSAAILLMCSETSLTSRNVKQEIALGWKYDRPYVPLLLEPVTIPGDVEYWLEAAQWISLHDQQEASWLAKLQSSLNAFGIEVEWPDRDAPTPNSRSRPLLVGREREQAVLRKQLERMLAGQGGTVLVGGEAGIGKTTLVEDLSIQAEDAGALVLWGHAYDLSVTPPYGPWLEIFRQYRSVADTSLPPVPAFVADAEELVKVGSQETLFAAVAEFFATVATRRPLILVLDDLHWVDQASLDFARVIVRQIAKQRILLVATYRSDEITRRHPLYNLMPLLVREAGAERLDVRPLNESGHRALIESRYTLTEPDERRLERYLEERAEGNPLYARELLRTLEDEAVLHAQAGTWLLGDLEEARVPLLLRQVIERRLERLPDDTRSLLQVAAIIGQDVPVELWQRVSGATDERLVTAIERGRAAQLLAEGGGGYSYRFRHALLREALYEDLVSLRRRNLHRRVAEALAETRNPDPDAVAYHFQQANDTRAAAWLIKAGERARRAYDWRTGVARFDAALARLTEHGAPAAERALLLYRVAYLQRYFDTERALMLMDEARLLAFEANLPALAARSLYLSGSFRGMLGELRLGLQAMEQADADYRALPSADQSALWPLLGIPTDAFAGTMVAVLANAGRFVEALIHGERQLAELAPPSLSAGQTESDYADILHGMGVALAFQGQPKRARPYFQQAHEIFEAIEHYGMVAYVCGCELAWILLPYFPEDHEGRRRLAAQAEDGVRRSSGTIRGVPARYRALGHLVLQGDWHEARAIATAIAAIPLWLSQLDGALWLVPLAYWQGDVELARRWVAEILPDGPATEVGTSYHVAPALQLQRVSVGMALDAHDLPTARAWLEANGRWLDWSGAVLGRAEGALLWARYHHANGALTESRAAAEQALAYASDPRQPLALIAVQRFLGQLDTEAGQFEAADKHLETSLKLAEACASTLRAGADVAGDRQAADGTGQPGRGAIAPRRGALGLRAAGSQADAGEGGGAGPAARAGGR